MHKSIPDVPVAIDGLLCHYILSAPQRECDLTVPGRYEDYAQILPGNSL